MRQCPWRSRRQCIVGAKRNRYFLHVVESTDGAVLEEIGLVRDTGAVEGAEISEDEVDCFVSVKGEDSVALDRRRFWSPPWLSVFRLTTRPFIFVLSRRFAGGGGGSGGAKS